jgi:hypothetical protein
MFDNRSLAQLVQSTGLDEPEVPTNQQLELL